MNHTRLILSSSILLEELSQWKTVISDDIGKYRKVIGINVAGLHEVRISYEDYATKGCEEMTQQIPTPLKKRKKQK